MANEELLAKIKAEIERLYGEYKDKFHQSGDQYHLGLIDGLDMAERVLDAIESEKPMNQDGLQEEIQRFLSNATMMNKGEWKGKYPISEMGFGVVARHFFNLGLNARKK